MSQRRRLVFVCLRRAAAQFARRGVRFPVELCSPRCSLRRVARVYSDVPLSRLAFLPVSVPVSLLSPAGPGAWSARCVPPSAFRRGRRVPVPPAVPAGYPF